jgi:nucleoside-diphosphate-sugar epimerase
MHLLIFGLGYSACAIAMAAREAGFEVSGVVRSPEKAALLSQHGLPTYAWGQVPESVLSGATHILSSVPTVEGQGDAVLPLIAGCKPQWLGYLSTTGVYGDWQGAWVDETSPTRAGNARLERRVAAEQQWLTRGAQVFRLAGIYGPPLGIYEGRSVLHDVLAGEARRIDKPGQVFSRIHIEDIAQVVIASMQRPQPGRIYNVCDDTPAPQREVVEFACELAGVPLPPLHTVEEAGLSPMGREFYSANRRVRNERIKRELDVTLRYPSYREGLAAIARAISVG